MHKKFFIALAVYRIDKLGRRIGMMEERTYPVQANNQTAAENRARELAEYQGVRVDHVIGDAP